MDHSLTCGGRVSTMLTALDELTDGRSENCCSYATRETLASGQVAVISRRWRWASNCVGDFVLLLATDVSARR